jgi:hypothetical protein
MTKVARDELLGLGPYEQIRDQFRARVIAEKKARRFFPAPELSVLFENHDSVLFQIQEMLRTERITAEAGIRHELETYNQLIPDAGELSATMFVEIADRDTRDRRLRELAGLESSIAIEVAGARAPAIGETRGELTDRTTAVHYLKFPLGAAGVDRFAAAARGAGDVLFVVAHPQLAVRAPIPASVVRALAADLGLA